MAAYKSVALFRYMDDIELSLCLLCVQARRSRAVDLGFVGVSRMGDGVFWYALMLALPLVYGYAGLTVSLRIAIVGLIGVSVYKGLKLTLTRERPFIRHAAIERGTAPLDVYSFPSGHTLHAVSFTTVSCWWFVELSWLLVPFTLLVALSRVVLGLHYPTDVLAGAALGFLMALLVCTW